MRCAFLVTAVLATATAAAHAQSDTGRHRPEPVATPSATTALDDGSAWHIALNVGLATAGDLFRAGAGGSVPWDPEGGPSFGSPEFVATLDEGFAYGVSVLRDVGPWLRVRADAAFTQLPITAEARVGETVRLYAYDDLSVATFGVALEGRLIRDPSHPYLLAGVAATVASAVGTDAYDQTVVALRFGAGYHQVLSRALALRFEVCNTMQSLDFEDYQPPVGLPIYPDVEIENLEPQHILALLAGLVATF